MPILEECLDADLGWKKGFKGFTLNCREAAIWFPVIFNTHCGGGVEEESFAYICIVQGTPLKINYP